MTRLVVTVRPGTPLKEVARLLVERKISGVPVVDEERRVLGVVSEADFLVKGQGIDAVRHRPLARILGESPETRSQLSKIEAVIADQAMTSPAITIEADRSLREAAASMVEHRVNRLPVTEDGVLVGIVTRADLVRAYVRPDEQLVETILQDVILRSLWLDPVLFDVSVRNGVARIRGRVELRSTAEMVERITAMVPGIVGVDADVTWELDDSKLEPQAVGTVSPFQAR